MIVRFSDSQEFIAELERDPHAVARKIVRVTKRGRPGPAGVTTSISVIATAKVASGSDYDLLRLEIPVGELWGIEGQDRRVQNRADDLVRLIEAGLDDSPFVVCAGLYEVEEAVAA